MEFIKLLLIVTFLTLIPGQVLRIPPDSSFGAITLTDISVLVLDFSFLFYSLAIKKSLKFPPKIFFPFAIFSVWSLATIIWAARLLSAGEILISSLFLVRFIIYFFLAVIAFNIVEKDKIRRWIELILTIGVIYILIGFVQFFTIPDLSFLTPFGWDPHQRRIVSTVIDPNFSGFIFVLLFSMATSFYFYSAKKLPYFIIALGSFIALILTFSRSSYLAFIAAIVVIGIVKSRKLLLGTLLVLLLIFTIVPQVRTRVVGALTLDETAQARIESWQNALTVTRDNPFFGVGFNTYRFTQERYNFFASDNPEGGHSGGGVDSSLLLVSATTGIIGLALFIFFLGSIVKAAAKNVSASPLHLATLASAAALLVHSIFVNSLFFPQIMLLIFPLVGLAAKDDK
ncbi:MAG: O-antigen ligase family protein [Candidatus Curtissbacteria bacterium]|nr:O-antigen ligase family protein [Candidatus Curtissbacteria bacterium]